MNMNLKNSKTEKNLLESFINESQTRMKYDLYASQAKKDGYEQIANFFKETSCNEHEHAEIFYRLLHGEINHTRENLKDAMDTEAFEHDDLYKKFSQEAHDEGYEHISYLFHAIGEIEHHHELRFKKLLENIETQKVFARDEKVQWQCMKCGYIHEAMTASDVCPVCHHKQAFFELKENNY